MAGSNIQLNKMNTNLHIYHDPDISLMTLGYKPFQIIGCAKVLIEIIICSSANSHGNLYQSAQELEISRWYLLRDLECSPIYRLFLGNCPHSNHGGLDMENWHHQFWQNDPLRSIVNTKFNRHVRLCEMVKKKRKGIKLEYKN